MTVEDMKWIGPEDIERNGYDGQYVRRPKSPGWVRLEAGWFEIKRPAEADSFMVGPVSDRAAPLRQAFRERLDASMAVATARGRLIQMQRVAARYRVPFTSPVDYEPSLKPEEARRLETAFVADREALLSIIKTTLQRRTRKARLVSATVFILLVLAGWVAAASFRPNDQNTPPAQTENAA